MFSLYGDLPAPKTKNDTEGDQSTNKDNTSTSGITPSTTASPSTKSTSTGWSNIQQFRPVMRKPTIQAKPKLVKPMIPAGATIVSSTTVNKNDPAPSVDAPSKTTITRPINSPNVIPPTTIRPLHTKSYTSTQDDVNGFRQNKKKGKQNALQNQGPPPIDLTEDYDPLRPTDYEQYKEEIEIIRQQERRLRRPSLSRRSSYSSDESSRSRSRSRSPSPRRPKNRYAPPPDLYNTSSSSSSSSNRQQRQQRHEHTSPSPPPSRHRRPSSPSQKYSRSPSPRRRHQDSPSRHNNVYIKESGDDAYNRRAMLSQQQPPRSMDTDNHQSAPTTTGSGENMAWKMMNKYGWQEGQGLGRGEDGIREALQVQARGDGSGIILPQKPAPPTQPQTQPHHHHQRQRQQPPIVSPVIVLKNMVGPGEVDDLLQQETADECKKYGHVEQCLIFEVPDGRVKDEEAVRIFVKFSHLQSAINAIADMNGRYFGGRVVSAETYDQDRFDKLDLAPVV